MGHRGHRLAELQARTYNAQGIADQLKKLVRVLPDLDPGEKVLWMESLVERVETRENRGVAALLLPPLRFGNFDYRTSP